MDDPGLKAFGSAGPSRWLDYDAAVAKATAARCSLDMPDLRRRMWLNDGLDPGPRASAVRETWRADQSSRSHVPASPDGSCTLNQQVPRNFACLDCTTSQRDKASQKPDDSTAHRARRKTSPQSTDAAPDCGVSSALRTVNPQRRAIGTRVLICVAFPHWDHALNE